MTIMVSSYLTIFNLDPAKDSMTLSSFLQPSGDSTTIPLSAPPFPTRYKTVQIIEPASPIPSAQAPSSPIPVFEIAPPAGKPNQAADYSAGPQEMEYRCIRMLSDYIEVEPVFGCATTRER